MHELIATRGLPASGKTTWAKEWVAEDPVTRVRVSRDDFRAMLYGATDEWLEFPGADSYGFTRYQSYFAQPDLHIRESAVTAAQEEAVRGLLENGRSVVVDDTNLRLRYLRKWKELALDAGVRFGIRSLMGVPVEECLRRDEARGWKVGQAVIEDMSAKARSMSSLEIATELEEVQHPWRYKGEFGLPYAWIVDIDGTVALKGDRSPYDYARVSEDEPNFPVLSLVAQLARGNTILFVSGREGTEQCQRDTVAWLDFHQRYFGTDVWRLFMRAEGDKRKDEVVKMEILRDEIAPHFNVLGAVDDRNRVVRMWRRCGLLCLQVADGAF